jgi:hypothetical protein
MLFEKACPEELRDRIFFAWMLRQKSDPSILRDMLFGKIGFLTVHRLHWREPPAG